MELPVRNIDSTWFSECFQRAVKHRISELGLYRLSQMEVKAFDGSCILDGDLGRTWQQQGAHALCCHGFSW